MATQILSSEVLFDDLQGDNRRYVRYKFVAEDNFAATSDIFVGPKSVPQAFSTAADLVSLEPVVLEQLALFDDEGVKETSFVADPLFYAQNSRWSTDKRIAKNAIRWMIVERSPRIVIYLEPLIVFLQDNFTANQIANFLDITVAQVIRLNKRVNAILKPPVVITAAKDLIEDFDAEEGEFE